MKVTVSCHGYHTVVVNSSEYTSAADCWKKGWIVGLVEKGHRKYGNLEGHLSCPMINTHSYSLKEKWSSPSHHRIRSACATYTGRAIAGWGEGRGRGCDVPPSAKFSTLYNKIGENGVISKRPTFSSKKPTFLVSCTPSKNPGYMDLHLNPIFDAT